MPSQARSMTCHQRMPWKYYDKVALDSEDYTPIAVPLIQVRQKGKTQVFRGKREDSSP